MKKPALVLLLIVLGLGGWWWHSHNTPDSTTAGHGKKGAGDRVVPAVIAKAEIADVPIIITALGTITAREQATVHTRVDGLLQDLLFKEGDLVKAGSVIARIDSRPFDATLKAAVGQLARDQAQLDSGRLDLKRYQTLLAQDSIASQQVDDQQALVKQLEGTVASDVGSVDTARLNVVFTKVTAPITGIAGLRQVTVGNLVSTTDVNGIVIIAQLQPITAVFAVPQENLPKVMEKLRDANGKQRELTVDALDRTGKTILDSGKLLALDNQIDSTTGTLMFKGLFENKASRLFPGQFVNIRLTIDTLHGAVVVPQGAIQTGAPGTYVYVVTPKQTASIRKVELGPLYGDRIVVTKGLSATDSVVTEGTDKLREGAPITMVTRSPASAGKQK
ncbi:efflux RND transporter periplasmic adaptor subunit [Govanella unica]|uniref:Efflux RND transporter periplasmic adaptor subunit n=1 Tax=Govanella unica TaxID=2975056 RepID=A0A9X3TYM9_9PROT|nr:efflux RND transporter periplasmic adaptor subunit [Govania unica]MDA5194391.1 efflux RND transporter periplasmic adaptor subunit [Govania unica]